MTHPGEQFYPEGVHWDDPLPRGTLPDLLSAAAHEFASRPAIEFRDRPISYAALEALVEIAAAAFLRAGESGIIPQRFEQGDARFELKFYFLAVDIQRHRHSARPDDFFRVDFLEFRRHRRRLCGGGSDRRGAKSFQKCPARKAA